MSYYNKYLKYKTKYNNLKKQIGGDFNSYINRLKSNSYNVYSIKDDMTDYDNFDELINNIYNYAKASEEHKNNIILLTVLENFINKTLHKYMEPMLIDINNKNILGPNTLSIHRSREDPNKIIYIFGEYHEKAINHCKQMNKQGVFVYDFLTKMFQESYSFIDFYVETPLYLYNMETVISSIPKQIIPVGKKRTIDMTGGDGDSDDDDDDNGDDGDNGDIFNKKNIIPDRLPLFTDLFNNVFYSHIEQHIINKTGEQIDKKTKTDEEIMIDATSSMQQKENYDIYKLVRYHAIDNRQLIIKGEILVDFKFMLYNFLKKLIKSTYTIREIFLDVNNFIHINLIINFSNLVSLNIKSIEELRKIFLETNIIIKYLGVQSKLIYIKEDKHIIQTQSYLKKEILDFFYNETIFDYKIFDYNNLIDIKYYLYILKNYLNYLKKAMEYVYQNKIGTTKNNIIDTFNYLEIIDAELKTKGYEILKVDSFKNGTNEMETITKDKYIELVRIAIQKLWSFFGDLNVMRMDVYTLSRIFRKFNYRNYKDDVPYDVEYNTYEKYHPDEPKNIIIYVGGDHATNYRNFLNKHPDKFETVFGINTADRDMNICLSLANVNLPFFQTNNLTV